MGYERKDDEATIKDQWILVIESSLAYQMSEKRPLIAFTAGLDRLVSAKGVFPTDKSVYIFFDDVEDELSFIERLYGMTDMDDFTIRHIRDDGTTEDKTELAFLHDVIKRRQMNKQRAASSFDVEDKNIIVKMIFYKWSNPDSFSEYISDKINIINNYFSYKNSMIPIAADQHAGSFSVTVFFKGYYRNHMCEMINKLFVKDNAFIDDGLKQILKQMTGPAYISSERSSEFLLQVLMLVFEADSVTITTMESYDVPEKEKINILSTINTINNQIYNNKNYYIYPIKDDINDLLKKQYTLSDIPDIINKRSSGRFIRVRMVCHNDKNLFMTNSKAFSTQCELPRP